VQLHANVFAEASICRLVSRFPYGSQITVNQTGAFYFYQACSEDVFNFFQRQTNDSYRFISELMDVYLMAGIHQKPDQSNLKITRLRLSESHTIWLVGLMAGHCQPKAMDDDSTRSRKDKALKLHQIR